MCVCVCVRVCVYADTRALLAHTNTARLLGFSQQEVEADVDDIWLHSTDPATHAPSQRPVHTHTTPLSNAPSAAAEQGGGDGVSVGGGGGGGGREGGEGGGEAVSQPSPQAADEDASVTVAPGEGQADDGLSGMELDGGGSAGGMLDGAADRQGVVGSELGGVVDEGI